MKRLVIGECGYFEGLSLLLLLLLCCLDMRWLRYLTESRRPNYSALALIKLCPAHSSSLFKAGRLERTCGLKRERSHGDLGPFLNKPEF